MGSTDESFSNTGYEPKDYFLTETYVESLAESMTEQRFLEDVDYDDAAIGEMLFNASMHTENKSITPSEKACLLVSRRQCPIERGNPLLKQWQKATIDRGNPLWKEVKN